MVTGFQPAYLELLGTGELKERVRQAWSRLEDCDLCARDCHVNRRETIKGAVCRTGERAVVSSFGPHFGEEAPLVGHGGSGTIFFSWCNLRCVFCLHPDTPIATCEGLVGIVDLFEQGENEVEWHGGHVRFMNRNVYIVTRQGTWAPVAKVFRHHFTGDLIMLKPFNCPPLLLTPNHEVCAVLKAEPHRVVKVRAENLTKAYYLVIPKRAPAGRKVELNIRDVLSRESRQFHKSPPRRISVTQLASLFVQPLTSDELAEVTGYHPAYIRKLRGQWYRHQLLPDSDGALVMNEIVEEDGFIRFKTERRPGIPACMILDEQLAWLLGIYCAEGHVTSHKHRPNSHQLIFSFGHQEINLANRTKQWLQDLFGVQASLRWRQTTVTVEVSKASVGLLFAQLCGKNVYEKQVPPCLTQATTEILQAFLQGVLDGDGCDRGTHLVISTVSRELAIGLFEIGLLLGVLPSFHRWQPPPTKRIEGREINQSPLYYVKFPKLDPLTGARHSRWKEMEHCFLVPLHKAERRPYEGPVFNLEIDDPDHSYLAPFVAVGNCQNYEISQLGHGGELEPQDIAAMMLRLQAQGCHNINFVSPSHVVSQILAAVLIAAQAGLRIPLVYNTGGYDSMTSLTLLDGVIDIYMPDMKYADPELARKYSKVRNYPTVNRAAVKEMHRQVGDLVLDEDGVALRGLLVRHLVMPDGIAGTAEIVRFLAEEISPRTYLNVMDQYRPCHKAHEMPGIDRPITREEYREAVRLAQEAGLQRLDDRQSRRVWLLWR